MLKRMLANTMAKKTSVFAAVFAITCILMGNKLTSMDAEADLIQMATASLSQKQLSPVSAISAALVVEAAYTIPPVSGEYPTPGTQPFFGAGKRAVPQFISNPPNAEGFVYCAEIPLSKELQRYTYNQCVDKGLEYELVLALMWRESRFKVDAVNINANGTQDSGIMQINDVNRGWLKAQYGITDLMDPMQNITAGTIMLGDFTRKFGVHDGLMAYQYGENGLAEQQQKGVYTNDKIALLLDKREDFHNMLQKA